MPQQEISSLQHDQVYARVSRISRWRWRIRILVPVLGDGLGDMTVDQLNAFGRKRAARIARRLINRYVRKHSWQDGPESEIRGGISC
jgi:hypothetical protein